MAPNTMQLLYAGFNFTNATSFGQGFVKFVQDRSLLGTIWGWFSDHGRKVMEWLGQPHVLAVIMAWWITFIVVLLLLSSVGFNIVGVGGGTAAAAFQSWAYGGFTPAGGIFATLTSWGMLGFLAPVETGLATVIATGVAVIVWACGVGT